MAKKARQQAEESKVTRVEVVPDSVRPWAASGPGWANRGICVDVRFYYQDEPPEDVKVCLYDHELLTEPALLYAAINLCKALELPAQKAVEARREKGEL